MEKPVEPESLLGIIRIDLVRLKISNFHFKRRDEMAIVQFDWKKEQDSIALPVNNINATKLSDDILISNIRWFIIFRWGIIVALILIHIVALITPDTLIQFRIIEENNWPLAITLVLSIANLIYIYAWIIASPTNLIRHQLTCGPRLSLI